MALSQPFRFAGRVSLPLVAVFVAINSLVAINAVIHDPGVGYDADAHLDYVHAIATGSLPSREQSREFYAPPLPYAIPALLGLAGITETATLAKAAQLANVAHALVLTYFLIRVCRRLRPADPQFATWALLLLGMLTVFYRTMAFVRGEALCAAIAVVLADRLLAEQRDSDTAGTVWLGVLAGLVLLAKEWGAFVVAGMVLFLALRGHSRRRAPGATWRSVASILIVASVIGGWFYPYLFLRFGSPATYSERVTQWSINHRPAEYFFGIGFEHLFTAPVRENFSQPTQQLLPIVYSDIWGDYGCYWLTDFQDEPPYLVSPARRYLGAAAPPTTIVPYMARLNVAGILPTAVFAGGGALGLIALARMLRRRSAFVDEGFALCTLAAFMPLAGIIVLCMWVPTMDIKASYLLPIFPFAAVLAAACLARLREQAPRVAWGLETLLLVALAHNAPAFLSRFSILS